MTRRRRRSRTGSNRRRRGRGKARLDWRMASLVLGSVGVVSLVGIAAIPSAVEFMNRPKVPQVALGAPLAEDTLVRGVVLDPSGSNGGTQSAQKDLELLADVVADWVGPPPPDDGTSAYAGMPGLDLTVRQVALNSFGADAQVAHIHVPGIPPLPAAPATTDVNASAMYLDQVDSVLKDYQRAQAQAERAATTLRSARLRSENSEVAGALSALVQVLPPSSQERQIVVVSDVEQAGASPQVDGDLSGTTVTVFQRCDEGTDRCDAARESFTSLTRNLNGTTPEFLRIEALPTNLAGILKGQ